MACILLIDTSCSACSVALSHDRAIIFEQQSLEASSAASSLPTMIDEALSFADSHAIPIDAIAISNGPGSYTGLRIGASMAKGLAFGRSLPIIAIDTLKLLCVPILLYHDIEDEALLCPMIDARRMEVYQALYDRALNELLPTSAQIIDEGFLHDTLNKHIVYFFGDGASKCKSIISHPNARFIDNIMPIAKHMLPLAEMSYHKQAFADTAYFEPFYLKAFQATTAKKLI